MGASDAKSANVIGNGAANFHQGLRPSRREAQQRARPASDGIGMVLPTALAVGRAVGQELALRTAIAVRLGFEDELALAQKAVVVGRPAVADHAFDTALVSPRAIPAV